MSTPSNDEMRSLAGAMRAQRIKRTPFPLSKFRGVHPEYVDKLASEGIRNVAQMLEAGRTPEDRQTLAEKTGVPLEAILEYVKLSDLARISGTKGIRARLYYDAGVDTLEVLARWDPVELRAMLIDFVERAFIFFLFIFFSFIYLLLFHPTYFSISVPLVFLPITYLLYHLMLPLPVLYLYFYYIIILQ